MECHFQPVCISTRLRRATRLTNRLYDDALTGTGVSVAQFSLLRAVERNPKATINDLATETLLEASTLGRNLRVLEKMGLLGFGPGTDKRTRVLNLTDAGKAQIELSMPAWRKVQEDLETRLGDSGRDELFDMLDTLTSPPLLEKADDRNDIW